MVNGVFNSIFNCRLDGGHLNGGASQKWQFPPIASPIRSDPHPLLKLLSRLNWGMLIQFPHNMASRQDFHRDSCRSHPIFYPDLVQISSTGSCLCRIYLGSFEFVVFTSDHSFLSPFFISSVLHGEAWPFSFLKNDFRLCRIYLGLFEFVQVVCLCHHFLYLQFFKGKRGLFLFQKSPQPSRPFQ